MECRLAEPRDAERLADLFVAMQAHYRVPCPPRPTIVADLAALPPGNRILIAEDGETVLGLAAFAEIWPGPGLRKGLFLKELYVADEHRGVGVGHRLMAALAGFARAAGHQRIDWTADRDDTDLLRFYDRTGAGREDSKLFYRLTGDRLIEMAAARGR
jgi:GNAT superfamily N-acetyltransferase